MEALRLNLLGPLQIFLEGRRLHALRSSRAQGLLVYLAVERRQPHGREAIGKLIWPGIPLASARSNLRQTVYQVRQAIPEVLTSAGRREPLIVADRQTIRINSGALLRLDVELLRQIHGATDPEPERLEEAAALYRGDFLVDQTLIEGDQFQTWVREQRELCRHLMAEIAGRAARRLLAREELDRAQAQARQVLELEPLNEPAHGLLMRILARRGQRVAALRLFQEYQDALQRELGIAPRRKLRRCFGSSPPNRSRAPLPRPIHCSGPLPWSAPGTRSRRRHRPWWNGRPFGNRPLLTFPTIYPWPRPALSAGRKK